MKAVGCLLALLAIVAANSEAELRERLAQVDAQIKQSEAKLRAIEGMRLYAERNKIAKVGPSHIEEMAALYQKSKEVEESSGSNHEAESILNFFIDKAIIEEP